MKKRWRKEKGLNKKESEAIRMYLRTYFEKKWFSNTHYQIQNDFEFQVIIERKKYIRYKTDHNGLSSTANCEVDS